MDVYYDDARCLVASWHNDSGPLVACTRTARDRSPRRDGPSPRCSNRSEIADLQREEKRELPYYNSFIRVSVQLRKQLDD